MQTTLKYPKYTGPIDRKKCTLELRNSLADFYHTTCVFVVGSLWIQQTTQKMEVETYRRLCVNDRNFS